MKAQPGYVEPITEDEVKALIENAPKTFTLPPKPSRVPQHITLPPKPPRPHNGGTRRDVVR